MAGEPDAAGSSGVAGEPDAAAAAERLRRASTAARSEASRRSRRMVLVYSRYTGEKPASALRGRLPVPRLDPIGVERKSSVRSILPLAQKDDMSQGTSEPHSCSSCSLRASWRASSSYPTAPNSLRRRRLSASRRARSSDRLPCSREETLPARVPIVSFRLPIVLFKMPIALLKTRMNCRSPSIRAARADSKGGADSVGGTQDKVLRLVVAGAWQRERIKPEPYALYPQKVVADTSSSPRHEKRPFAIHFHGGDGNSTHSSATRTIDDINKVSSLGTVNQAPGYKIPQGNITSELGRGTLRSNERKPRTKKRHRKVAQKRGDSHKKSKQKQLNSSAASA